MLLPGISVVMFAGAKIVGVPTLLAAGSVIDETQYNDNSSFAQITLTRNGIINNNSAVSGSYPAGAWIAPLAGMDEFSVRWTAVSGTLSVGTAGVWTPLSGDVTYGVSVDSGLGNKNANGTLEIARSDKLTTILASKTGIQLHAASSHLSPP